MDRREHRRVRMRLPVRLRWTTPFGQKIELCETTDVSRSGLRVSTKERHFPGVPLWVTFPYDSSLSDGQPEILAHVVRCEDVLEVSRTIHERKKVHSESASTNGRFAKLDELAHALGISDAPSNLAVAIHLDQQAHAAFSRNGHRREPERRSSPRRALALPVRVRPEQIPWFEEAMAIDFSANGLRFRSYREYQLGDHLKVTFEGSALTPWAGIGEFRSVVVRVAPAPDNFAMDICVCRVE